MIRQLLNILCLSSLALWGCTGDDETNFLHLEVQGEIDLGPEAAGQEVTLNVAWWRSKPEVDESHPGNSIPVALETLKLQSDGRAAFSAADIGPPPDDARFELSEFGADVSKATEEPSPNPYEGAEGEVAFGWIIGCTVPNEAGLCVWPVGSLPLGDEPDDALEGTYLLSLSHQIAYFGGLNQTAVEALAQVLGDRFPAPDAPFPAEIDKERVFLASWKCGYTERPILKPLSREEEEVAEVTFFNATADNAALEFLRHKRCDDDMEWQREDLQVSVRDEPQVLRTDALDPLIAITLEEILVPQSAPRWDDLSFRLDREGLRSLDTQFNETTSRDANMEAELADSNRDGYWNVGEIVMLRERLLERQFWNADDEQNPPFPAKVYIFVTEIGSVGELDGFVVE